MKDYNIIIFLEIKARNVVVIKVPRDTWYFKKHTFTSMSSFFFFKWIFFYSEENVWKLCEHIQAQEMCPLDEVHAVFISNENKAVGKDEWENRLICCAHTVNHGFVLCNADPYLETEIQQRGWTCDMGTQSSSQ